MNIDFKQFMDMHLSGIQLEKQLIIMFHTCWCGFIYVHFSYMCQFYRFPSESVFFFFSLIELSKDLGGDRGI